jgi:hypothetical protein
MSDGPAGNGPRAAFFTPVSTAVAPAAASNSDLLSDSFIRRAGRHLIVSL